MQNKSTRMALTLLSYKIISENNNKINVRDRCDHRISQTAVLNTVKKIW